MEITYNNTTTIMLNRLKVADTFFHIHEEKHYMVVNKYQQIPDSFINCIGLHDGIIRGFYPSMQVQKTKVRVYAEADNNAT